jgi:hypothetical protein
MWSRALDAAEILAVYDDRPEAVIPDLVSAWSFSECAGGGRLGQRSAGRR